ncbi:MAG TPA: FAD-dependent oxidoreductase, partial [Casimicrobiaceae bacterium]
MAQNKYAAYLCAGCGLGERLDLPALEKIAQREGKMQFVRRHDFLCSEAGMQMIRDDIDQEGVTHAVVAACSRRAKTEAFDFAGVALARANLREGVVWAVADGEAHKEIRQEMAADYVRMACAEVKKMKVPAGNADRGSSKRILVVGGGISGLTAALEAAETGYEVVLVERKSRLGGWAARLWKRAPSAMCHADPQPTGVAELAAKVGAHPRIHVYTSATVVETSGAPGRFQVKVAQESGTV